MPIGSRATKELGISGAELSRTERLLSLTDDIQALVDSWAVPESIAYEISRLPDEVGQRELAEAVAAGKMNRKAVKETVAATVPPKNVKAKDSQLSCRIDGVAVSVAADAPLTLDTLIAVFRRLLRETDGLKKNGKTASDLAARLKSS
jgi:ParB family chromosome partitioning protein